MVPGEILTAEGELLLNPGLETREIKVANGGDRPVQVGSHFQFFKVNPALQFDRERARGWRLGIPAGTAMGFEPGQTRLAPLVSYRGGRRKGIETALRATEFDRSEIDPSIPGTLFQHRLHPDKRSHPSLKILVAPTKRTTRSNTRSS